MRLRCCYFSSGSSYYRSSSSIRTHSRKASSFSPSVSDPKQKACPLPIECASLIASFLSLCSNLSPEPGPEAAGKEWPVRDEKLLRQPSRPRGGPRGERCRVARAAARFGAPLCKGIARRRGKREAWQQTIVACIHRNDALRANLPQAHASIIPLCRGTLDRRDDRATTFTFGGYFYNFVNQMLRAQHSVFGRATPFGWGRRARPWCRGQVPGGLRSF